MTRTSDARGLKPTAIRRALAALQRFVFPACMPLVLILFALGTVTIGFGWWSSLPAVLPGDELYAIERVAGFTGRTLAAWPLPPDAPPMRSLSTFGVVITLFGVAFLACGVLLRVLREFTQRSLIASARDLRVVYLDDEAGHGIAETVSPFTTVRLLPEETFVSSALYVCTSLNDRFWTKTSATQCRAGPRVARARPRCGAKCHFGTPRASAASCGAPRSRASSSSGCACVSIPARCAGRSAATASQSLRALRLMYA